MADDGKPSLAKDVMALPVGNVRAVNFVGGSTGWPARPTSDPTVVVQWIGGTTTPPGAIPGVDFWVRPSVIGDLVAGSTVTVYWNAQSSTWPQRPTRRTDITVLWIGGTTASLPPSTNGVDMWIRDATAD